MEHWPEITESSKPRGACPKWMVGQSSFSCLKATTDRRPTGKGMNIMLFAKAIAKYGLAFGVVLSWHKNRPCLGARQCNMQLLEKLVAGLTVTPTCPRCKGTIPSEDVNVASDIAFCRRCNLSHRLSALTLGTAVDENVDVSRPPAGTWFRRAGDSVVIGSTHRSLGQAFGLLFFCLFWNGIVSVFVCLATASTLHHFGVPLPAGLPMVKGSFTPIGMTVFLWLFLMPFIGIGLVLVGTFLSCRAGRTDLRLDGREGVLFTGIGWLGFRKRFSLSEVRDVRIEDKRWRESQGDSRRETQIVIETNGKLINFGSMLTEERRRFVAGAAKRELLRG